MSQFKIHPGIGIARMGNSEDFYLAPEQPGALPLACDAQGRELTNKDGAPIRVERFKDENDLSKIKRQGARFKVFIYDNDKDEGREVKLGETYQFLLSTSTTGLQRVEGVVTDIEWKVHLANKKASWYEFQETAGRHGYSPSHPLRNAHVTEPQMRRQLIIDPGPVSASLKKPNAAIAKGETPGYPQSFPPEDITPHSINSLGDLLVNKQDDSVRLVVLGGHGRSGSTQTPIITSFVNNDHWFDDTSDGPVTATIHYQFEFKFTDANGKPVSEMRAASTEVDVPAWVVVGYPRYVPQIQDMVTMEETLFDLYVRNFEYKPVLYGKPPFAKTEPLPTNNVGWASWREEARYNPDYFPKYYQEIWPILTRPDTYRYLYDFDFFGGGDPHNKGTDGNLDEQALAQPPRQGEDPNYQHRQFIYGILRHPGQENQYYAGVMSRKIPNYKPRAMPLQCGHNPISNTAPEKFFRLTDSQLFILKQWADGKFVNECVEWGMSESACKNANRQPPTTGAQLDRGVMSNVLGGAFCPGAEMSWIMLNPAIYSAPYRIKAANYQAGALSLPKIVADIDGSPAADIASGMEPGDLTKYIGIPWQADFHECTFQNINITYEDWNTIYPDSTGDPVTESIAFNVPWWPAHRPMVVVDGDSGQQVYWASGLSNNFAGDLQMVQEWKNLGFIKEQDGGDFAQVERNNQALGEPVAPGDRMLGQSTKRRR